MVSRKVYRACLRFNCHRMARLTPMSVFVLLSLLMMRPLPSNLRAADVLVANRAELQVALSKAQPGDRIRLKSGEYPSGFGKAGLQGTAESPVVIESEDPLRPAVLSGGGYAFHFSGCAHLTIRHLRVKGCSGNGINIDDGGNKAAPAEHIRLDHIIVEDIGPKGNHDGFKLSGVSNFRIIDCQVRGWGGSGIDLVGCHQGVISGCTFEGKEGFSQSNAVQIKGGSSDIRVKNNTFLRPGQRGVNIGGSTGLEFFRPSVTPYEAYRVEVSHNRFVGSLAPIAWVNADGGHVHHNTIYHPEKWVARILQENRGAAFKPSRGGVFEQNLIVYNDAVQIAINIGDMTAPDTFVFRGNAWFHSDARSRPPRSLPLPTKEEGGVYGVDPKLENAGTAKISGASNDPRLTGKGAQISESGRNAQ